MAQPTTPSSGPVDQPRGTLGLVAVLMIGAGVSVGLGVAARVHPATGEPLFTLGFPSLGQMKVWLSTVVVVLAVVQVCSALVMYGRIGGSGDRGWARRIHRMSGVAAVVVSLPVAFQCLWVFGFGFDSPRVLAHSLAGCLFYGAFVAKMLALRSDRVPGWTLPVLGGALLTLVALAWLTSALWWWVH